MMRLPQKHAMTWTDVILSFVQARAEKNARSAWENPGKHCKPEVKFAAPSGVVVPF